MSVLTNPRTVLALIAIFYLLALLPLPNRAQRNQVIFGRPVALVIDMQPVFLSRIDPGERRREMSNIVDTLDFCHGNDIPIINIEMDGAGEVVEPIRGRVKRYGAAHISKTEYSAFRGTDLKEMLKEFKAVTVILIGVNASVCVKATATDALAEGFAIATSREIIAEPREWHPGIRSFESINWFTDNGVYCDKYKDLLYVISHSDEHRDITANPLPAGIS
jgi:nicotinamidase-related amidase